MGIPLARITPLSGMAITRGETPSGGAPSQLSRREVSRATYKHQPKEISPTTAMRWGPRPGPVDPPSSCNAFGFTWVPKGEPTTRCKIEKKCLGQNVSRLWLFRRILSAPGSLSPTRLRLASGLGIYFEPLRCDTPASPPDSRVRPSIVAYNQSSSPPAEVLGKTSRVRC